MAVLYIRNSSGEFEGVQSLNGKTAYQAAKEGGYAGTESEFNTKLAQEIPTALPNPQPITINGQFYNGSEAVTLTTVDLGAATEEEVNQLKNDVTAITPDDTEVDGKPWTSKKTVDSLCMPFEASGNPVQVYPVEGYPLGVRVGWEPVQAGEGDPSPQNIRPITGRDSVSITIGNGMDSKTTDIALPETVYGVELDWNTGVLTVDIVKAQIPVNKIRKTDGDNYFFTTISDLGAQLATGVADYTKCNVAKGVSAVNNSDTKSVLAVYANGIIRLYLEGITTLEEMKTFMTENSIEFVYQIKTPYTIQLTPQQISALSGVNTLYTDAGTLTVTGREDPRHTISELKNAIISLGGNI